MGVHLFNHIFSGKNLNPLKAVVASLVLIAGSFALGDQAFARGRASKSHTSSSKGHAAGTKSHGHSSHSVSGHGHSGHIASGHAIRGHHTSSRGSHHVAASHGRSRHHVASKSSRHHGHVASKPHPRYAYPIGIFMRNAPAFDTSPLEAQEQRNIVEAFNTGTADGYPARTLVRSGLVKYHPLHGGIFWRREPVKYIVMHSTETGIPLSAVRVIESWSSMGIRHPGAQYVVDRDGTIYQAVDPDLATVHVNIFKTLPGINNDNSIGIEMNHTGSQDYPQEQRAAVIKLVNYLQRRYNVADGDIITHRYAQQGDHTDPVNFDWDGFIATKNGFRSQAIAYRSGRIREDARQWRSNPEPAVNTYLKPHGQVTSVKTSEPKDIEVKEEPVSEMESGNGAAENRAPVSVSPQAPAAKASPSTGSTSGAIQAPALTPSPTPAPSQGRQAPLPGGQQAPLPGQNADAPVQIEQKSEDRPVSPKTIEQEKKAPSDSSLNKGGELHPTVRYYPPGYFSNPKNNPGSF